jgi:DNA-binding response OmpR family regulator
MDGGVTVVIAEDEQDLRDLISYTLESAGYAVEAYGNGGDCWERLRDGDAPGIVLLDIMLPGLDGHDVLKRIRATGRLADVPVVLLSGRGQAGDALAELNAQPDDYIPKPFSPNELRERVGRLL